MTNGKKQITNVFEAILEYGHDEDFVPNEGNGFDATDAPAAVSYTHLTLPTNREV